MSLVVLFLAQMCWPETVCVMLKYAGPARFLALRNGDMSFIGVRDATKEKHEGFFFLDLHQ